VNEFTDFDFLIGLTAIRDVKYREMFVAERPPHRYRVVDSGIFEDPQNPPTNRKLLDIATTLDADEVIPTDFLNDMERTIHGMETFLEMSDDFPFAIQGVVQGKSLREWLYCFQWMEENPRVDVIGVSYCEIPHDMRGVLTDFGIGDESETARLALINLLSGGLGVSADLSLTGDARFEFIHRGPLKKPIHLLGLRSPKAIPHYRIHPLIRSIDTSFAVQLGVEGRPLHMGSVKPHFKMNFGGELVRAERALIANNVCRFLELCRGVENSMSWESLDRLSSLKEA
jgi:hypothetical protein